MSSTDGSGRRATVHVGSQTVGEKATGVQVVVGGAQDPRRSTIPNDPGAPPFTGRSDELAAIDQAFAAPESSRVFVLHGRPGVGKSRLAMEYALTRQARYPGGTFFIRCDAAPPSDLAKLLPLLGLSREPEERIEDQCLRVLHHLGARPTLLVYDNVPDPNVLQAWLPPAGTACHVLATSTFADWAPPWQAWQVDLFPDDDARALVGKLLTTKRTTAKDVYQVVRKARGITVELCAVARNVDYEARHGRDASLRAALATDTESSFAAAWRLLSGDAQLLLRAACLFAIGRILPDALQALLIPEGWDEARFNKALDAVRDRGLLAGSGEMFEVHQLVAAFVQRQATPELPGALVERHFAAFVTAADEYGNSPGDAQRSARFLAYPLELDFWAALSSEIPVLAQHAHVVGYGMSQAGRFDEALPWYERAVEAKQKGDFHGRVDLQSLGTSLHEVGICHSRSGRFAEALPWYERAVEAKQKGNIHGRVDQDSLGRSLHQVGHCHLSAGRFNEALPFCKRAVEATQKGDIHGRVDLQILGMSLHQVGYCHFSASRFDEALPFFARAVEAAQKGDFHGRVDLQSLGMSLHQVGHCHFSAGRFDEALPFCERAVEAKQKGDFHGRVDHESLGKSLHQVGDCHFRAGRFDEALAFCERAVEAKQKGDIHGRVDQDSLRISLEAVDVCRTMLGIPPLPDR